MLVILDFLFSVGRNVTTLSLQPHVVRCYEISLCNSHCSKLESLKAEASIVDSRPTGGCFLGQRIYSKGDENVVVFRYVLIVLSRNSWDTKDLRNHGVVRVIVME